MSGSRCWSLYKQQTSLIAKKNLLIKHSKREFSVFSEIFSECNLNFHGGNRKQKLFFLFQLVERFKEKLKVCVSFFNKVQNKDI